VKLSCADRIVVVCGLLLSLFCFSAAAEMAVQALLTTTAAADVAVAVVVVVVAAAVKQNVCPVRKALLTGAFFTFSIEDKRDIAVI